MTDNTPRYSRTYRESSISAFSVGFFFILIGTIYVITPNIINRIEAFFRDFALRTIPHIDSSVMLPAPTSPWTHTEVYSAAALFSLVWGIFLICVLLMRFYVHSPVRKTAETASDIVFWLGATYLNKTLLTQTTTITTWFAFWAMLVMLLGFALIIRGIILAAMRQP